jgi:hypothetical protein
MMTLAPPVKDLVTTVMLIGVMAMAGRSAAQSPQAESSGSESNDEATVLRPADQGISGNEILQELVKHNDFRSARLQQYSALRTYAVRNTQGTLYARQIVQVDYHAPDKKTFLTKSEDGSHLIRNRVLRRLMESEAEVSGGEEHRDSSITPANYTFDLLGQEQVGPYQCFVVQANPKRRDKYLFEGKVWIDARDFAIVKIAGQPARKLSFWIERAEFVRQFQKVGEFWLPLRDETLVEVKWYGKKIVTIEHQAYTLNGAESPNYAR